MTIEDVFRHCKWFLHKEDEPLQDITELSLPHRVMYRFRAQHIDNDAVNGILISRINNRIFAMWLKKDLSHVQLLRVNPPTPNLATFAQNVTAHGEKVATQIYFLRHTEMPTCLAQLVCQYLWL